MIIKFEDYEKIQEKINSEGLESVKEGLSSSDYKTFQSINEFDPVSGLAIFSAIGGEAALVWAAGLWSGSKILNFLSKKLPGGVLKRIDKLMNKYSEAQVEKVNAYEDFIVKAKKAIEKVKKGDSSGASRDTIELRKNISRQEKYLLDKYDNETIPIRKAIDKIRKKHGDKDRIIDYIDEKMRVIDKELIESMGKALEKSTGIIWSDEEARARTDALEKQSEELGKEGQEMDQKYKDVEVEEEPGEEGIDKNKIEKIALDQIWSRTNSEGKEEKVKIVKPVNKEDYTVIVSREGKKYKIRAMSLDNLISTKGAEEVEDIKKDPEVITDKGKEEVDTEVAIDQAKGEAEKEEIPVEEEINKGMNKWFDDAKEDIERKLVEERKDFSPGDNVRYTRKNGQENSAIVSKDQSGIPEGSIKMRTEKNPNGFEINRDKIIGKVIEINSESYELLKKDLINLYGKLVFYYKEVEGDDKGMTKGLKFSLVSFASKLYGFKKSEEILNRELSEEELQKQFDEYEK